MFEEALQKSMFEGNREKTFIDKLLAKEDVDRLRELIKEPKLKREQLLELLYLLGSTESKLLNYGEWERYVILKFFVWIREFIKVAELLYDYKDDLEKKEKTCKSCKKFKKEKGITDFCKCKTFQPSITLTDRTRQLLFNNERLIEHNAKFLIDLYLNISRTTLSLGATGIMEILKNKYEIAYPNMPATQTPQTPNTTTGGLISIGKRGG